MSVPTYDQFIEPIRQCANQSRGGNAARNDEPELHHSGRPIMDGRLPVDNAALTSKPFYALARPSWPAPRAFAGTT